MKSGTFSYNETLYDIYSKVLRYFSFKSCPYLSDSKLRLYNSTNVLSISGPSLSGKTLLISHIIFDFITNKNLTGKVVLIDTEFGFDYETLMSKFESQDSDEDDGYAERCLKKLLYLPVRNNNEFITILNSIDMCLRNGSLKVHALLIDSMTSVSTWFFSEDVKIIDKSQNITTSQIIDFCQRYSIFFIYTSDLEVNMKKTYFSVELKVVDNQVAQTDVNNQKEEGDVLSPTGPKDNTLEYNFPLTELLVSFESNNSNDYKGDFEEKIEMCKVDLQNNVNGGQVECPDVDESNRMLISTFIPETWVENDLNEGYRNRMAVLLSTSRAMDKKYITFISKDYRCGNKEKDKKKGKNEVNGLEIERNQLKRRLEREVGPEVLVNHDFRVYRLDSSKTYTKCSYELHSSK